MNINIVTWNMGYSFHKHVHAKAWKYLQNEIEADFNFGQEARPPKTVERDTGHLI